MMKSIKNKLKLDIESKLKRFCTLIDSWCKIRTKVKLSQTWSKVWEN